MNLMEHCHLHASVLDAVRLSDVSYDDIKLRATLLLGPQIFAESHLDFETDTNEFWITVSITGAITIHRHSKQVYCREKFVMHHGGTRRFVFGNFIRYCICGE